MLAPPYIVRRVQSQKWMLPRVVYVLIAASISMYSLFFLRAVHAGPALLNFLPSWAAGSADGDRAVQASWFEMGHLPEQDTPDDEHLAICVAVKEQQEDMVEWLVHHYHHMGVKRFYIMDDGSKPPLATFDYPGVPRSALTFTYQPREMRQEEMQLEYYRRCLKRWSHRHTWMAFIDADEFLYTPGPESLLDILRPLEANLTIGAFAVNWQTHTSNGLKTRPESARKSFTECVADHGGGPQGEINRHIKTIVKTEYCEGPRRDPHSFYLLNHTKVVGEDEQAVAGPFRPSLTRNRVGLAHYALKSRAEFVEKSNRGTAQSNYKGDAFWDALEKYARHTNCTELVHYEP